MSGLACQNRKGDRVASFHSPFSSNADCFDQIQRNRAIQPPVRLLVANGSSTTLYRNNALAAPLVFPA